MSKGLKRPWKYDDCMMQLESAEGAIVGERVDAETAEIILQAVNHHDKLMRQLEQARAKLRQALNVQLPALEMDICATLADAKLRQLG